MRVSEDLLRDGDIFLKLLQKNSQGIFTPYQGNALFPAWEHCVPTIGNIIYL